MTHAVMISGSPTAGSRLNGLTRYSQQKLLELGIEAEIITVIDLPSEDLLRANFQHPAIRESLALVSGASAVIIASPVYKAAYSGLVKTFLDLLPQDGLRDKLVLPLFIGGTIAHLLSVDYALKPVVAALGGRHILGGVYAVDQWVVRLEDGKFALTDELKLRLDNAVTEFADELNWKKVRSQENVVR